MYFCLKTHNYASVLLTALYIISPVTFFFCKLVFLYQVSFGFLHVIIIFTYLVSFFVSKRRHLENELVWRKQQAWTCFIWKRTIYINFYAILLSKHFDHVLHIFKTDVHYFFQSWQAVYQLGNKKGNTANCSWTY